MLAKKSWIPPVILGVLALFVWFFYWKLLFPSFLTFSDSAKFADLAKNIVLGRGYGASFGLFDTRIIDAFNGHLLLTNIPPSFPFSISIFFRVFGITDYSVILSSVTVYLAGAITLYFLGKKVFGELVGILASLAFIFDPAMLNYATSGASESLFIFEIILAALLFYINNKVSQFFGFFVLLLMYFTRPSAVIYIFDFALFFIFLRFRKKSQILKVGGVAILVWLLSEAALVKFAGKYFLYSPISSFIYGTAKFSPLAASTETLRGGMISAGFQIKPFISKFFYNLYNFYKLLPNILSPYLAAFFFLSLFRWEKEREKRIFRLIVLLMVAATFVATAAFLPIYRYLHPVVPFIYLLAIEMLVWVLTKLFKNPRKVWLTAFLLIFVFVIGQTLGKIFFDSRYLRAHTNPDKPPVYVQLSWLLKENTNPDDLIITNLDTWGSWYGERKTIWFPLQPSQLIPSEGKELKIDAIYLTSYKMDDENYFMGEEWREIFYSSEEFEDPFFAENFELAGKFEIEPEETYERERATAILLRRTK